MKYLALILIGYIAGIYCPDIRYFWTGVVIIFLIGYAKLLAEKHLSPRFPHLFRNTK